MHSGLCARFEKAGCRLPQELVGAVLLLRLAKQQLSVLLNRTTDRFFVQSIAPLVLRHRIVTNFHAESEGITTDDIIKKLLDTVRA